MPHHTTQDDGSAIVIGASIAGLLAASVIAKHFEDVVLIERDRFPPLGDQRKGVPQGRHIHVLLERGRRIMERRLPGITDDLLALDACHIPDASRRVRWHHSGFHQPGTCDVGAVALTRPKLEASIRRRVLSLRNVRAIDGARVVGLITNGAGRVTGVRYHSNDGGDALQDMPADLVVDAGGRGARAPEWLAELGYGRPAAEEVHIGLSYTSYMYARRPHHAPELDGVIFLTPFSRKRFGVMIAQEDRRWMVTMGGFHGARAPTAPAEFIEYARRLPAPDIYDVIKDEEPLTDAAVYRFPGSLRRHYERLSPFPEGYVVFGDALCSFNPVYGQGMTVAALEADALDECLAGGRNRVGPRFFTRAKKIVDLAWSTAVGNDLGYPETQGRRTLPIRLINWYLGHLHRAACDDAEVSIAFLRVINMVAPPPSILHPRIVARVLRQRLRRSAAD
ncbi:MAG TPA: hypothetical protein VJ992_16095 [Gemmatimonadales bacterium]|nr:hypothetical protein [Gemmatimonadales bacterium]